MEEKEQWRQISIYHDGIGSSQESRSTSGHFGRDKTLSLMASKMFFPKMKEKITSYVSSCERCQRVKAGSKFEKGGDKLKSIPVPHGIWVQIGIDMVTCLPETEEGYTCIVSAIDYKSKWVESKPLKSKCANGVAQFLFECLCRFGAAKVQISDQGREFVNQVCDRFYELSGTRHNITSAYHPQANGQIERFNRTKQEAFLKTQELHAEIRGHDKDWARRLPGNYNFILFILLLGVINSRAFKSHSRAFSLVTCTGN